MSLGIYNPKYFENNPEEAEKQGLLYCVVLVDKATDTRECVKIGITKGSNYRDAIKRAGGFTGYDIRIQKLVSGPLKEIYYLEEYLHELWQDYKYKPKRTFGGHTELFEIGMLPHILKSIPEKL